MRFSLVVLIIAVCSCGYIYKSVPKIAYGGKMKAELRAIENYRYFQTLDYGEFTYKKDDTEITLKNFTSILNLLNVDMLSFSTEEDKFILSYEKKNTSYFGAYSIKMKLLATSSKTKKEEIFTFYMISNKYKLTKSYVQEESAFKQKATVELEFEPTKIEPKGETSIPTSDIEEALKQFIEKNLPTWVENFNKNVEKYYSEVDKKTTAEFKTSTAQIPLSHTLSVPLEAAPKIQENNVFFSYTGKLDDHEQAQVDPYVSDEGYSVAFSKQLIDDIVKYSTFSFFLEESTKSVKDYTLNVENLKKVCEFDKKEIADNAELRVDSEMKSVSGSNLEYEITTESLIKLVEDQSVLQKLEWTAKVKLTMTRFQNGINFIVLGKDVSIASVKGDPLKITDEETLKSWMKVTLDVALSKREYNLFSSSIDLTSLFKGSKPVSVSDTEKYVVVTGSPKI